MRSHKYARIKPYDGKSVNNKAYGNNERKQCLISMNVREDQIFAYKSW
jgi:hypothetical protein